MSCTTDEKLRTFGRRGSILMEFVIVLPIYFILMGTVFTLGEMGLKVIGLSTGGRILAQLQGESFTQAMNSFVSEVIRRKTPHSYDDDIQMTAWGDEIDGSHMRGAMYRAKNGSFKGAWLCYAGGKVTEKYALPPWVRGWLQYPVLRYEEELGEKTLSKGALNDLLTVGDLGRVLLSCKDPQTRYYHYYTLKRTYVSRVEKVRRRWTGAALSRSSSVPVLTASWHEGVYGEPPTTGLDKDVTWDSEALDALASGGGQGQDEPPGEDPKKDYKRSGTLTLYSQ